MKRRIGALDQMPESCIESYPLYFSHNVRSIQSIFDKEEKFGWTIEEDIPRDEDCPVFLYLDGSADDPFGHWVFECGVFLPLFFLLKKQYPSIRLLSFNTKKYKDIFYKGFSLSDTDLASELPLLNKVIFTQWNSLGDHDPIRRERFMDHAHVFYTSLIQDVSKDIDFLYLPRGIKENFKSNDRIIPGQQKLIELIPQLIQNQMIYFTDETENIRDQINLIRRAKIILLDYGSSLLVNGFFAENTIIFVLGDFGQLHCKNPKPYLLLQETLKRKNKYYYLPPAEQGEVLIYYIHYLLSSGAPPYSHECICWKSCEDCKDLI